MGAEASDANSKGASAALSPFEQLKNNLGQEWPEITAARGRTAEVDTDLRTICASLEVPQETGVVAFGSLARDEWTSGSDVDWAFLVDGQADPEHFRLEQLIAETIRDTKYVKPGDTGTFAAMVSSHELIHYVGGTEDSNQNLTRRILLLLESTSLTDPVVHERVVKAILKRYIVCDPAVSSLDQRPFRVPRFLLNDMVRYWRTVAVDYASKKWQQREKKWALRNVKLRMSRKLFFVKGLLICFDCELNPDGYALPEEADSEVAEAILATRCFHLSRMTPLDLLCSTLLERCGRETAEKIVSAYDSFLGKLHDEQIRVHLERLRFEESSSDSIFQDMREISHAFRDGLDRLFFDENEQLCALTRKYGVF